MVVFGLIGYGLVKAAIGYDPRTAIGLDGALNKLSHYSYGPFLLGVVAAGLIGFALYSSPTPATRRSDTARTATTPPGADARDPPIMALLLAVIEQLAVNQERLQRAEQPFRTA